MNNAIQTSSIKKKQHGFTMIAAIFLLVGLAALGSFMVTFSNTQHLTSAQDFQGTRAYWAAHAGIVWAIASITTSANTPRTCPAANSAFVVEGFNLSVNCTRDDHSEGTATVSIYRVTSVASTGGAVGGLGFTERSLSVILEQ